MITTLLTLAQIALLIFILIINKKTKERERTIERIAEENRIKQGYEIIDLQEENENLKLLLRAWEEGKDISFERKIELIENNQIKLEKHEHKFFSLTRRNISTMLNDDNTELIIYNSDKYKEEFYKAYPLLIEAFNLDLNFELSPAREIIIPLKENDTKEEVIKKIMNIDAEINGYVQSIRFKNK